MRRLRLKLLESKQEVKLWSKTAKLRGRLVVTNGCFDLLHHGHAQYLETARRMGDYLLVGVNADKYVTALKGPGRPIQPQEHRAEVLAALEAVDAVYIFHSKRATQFLRLARPSIWVKSGGYTLQTLDRDECEAVAEMGGEVVLLPATKGISTTMLVARLNAAPMAERKGAAL